MRQLLALEQHVMEANALLMHENWLQLIPQTSINEAFIRLVGLRSSLLDSIFHFSEVLGALQLQINSMPYNGSIPCNSVDRNVNLYSAEQLFDMQLQALTLILQPSIVEDVVKHHRLYVDELRLQIAGLTVRGKNTV
jgi:hypothetical protein